MIGTRTRDMNFKRLAPPQGNYIVLIWIGFFISKVYKRRKNANEARAPLSSFSKINLGVRKIPNLFVKTCAHVYCIYAKFHSITLLHVAYRKNTNTHFKWAFIFVIGPEVCLFCTTYKSQDFLTKLNTFLRNKYMFPWIFILFF